MRLNKPTAIVCESKLRPGEEAHCPVCRDVGWVTRTNVPGEPGFGKPIPCECQRKPDPFPEGRRFRFDNYRVTVHPIGPSGDKTCDCDHPTAPCAFSTSLVNCVQSWASSSSAFRWLVLQGPPGGGKTHLAYASFFALVDRGCDVVHLRATDLFDALKAGFNANPKTPGRDSDATPFDALWHRITTVEWFVLDDLGMELGSEWARERLDSLFDYRYLHQLPTLVTTNLLLSELPDRLGSRLQDTRLSRVCTLNFRDYRTREES